MRTLRTNSSEILSVIHTFSFKKNAFENVVCKMASISSRPRWVNAAVPCLGPSFWMNSSKHCCLYLNTVDVSIMCSLCTLFVNYNFCKYRYKRIHAVKGGTIIRSMFEIMNSKQGVWFVYLFNLFVQIYIYIHIYIYVCVCVFSRNRNFVFVGENDLL